MKKKSKIALGASVATLSAVAILFGSSVALADSTGGTLAERIATKFNLNKADVQSVFDNYKTEKQTERQAENSTRLQALVDKGTITADQKAKIEAKQKELQTARESERTALEKWATDNGIDEKYLMGGGMGGRGHNGAMTENSTRLQALVDKGTITADQKAKIEAKQKELQTARESERTALEKWATDNGIDEKYLMGGGMGGRGHGGPMGEEI